MLLGFDPEHSNPNIGVSKAAHLRITQASIEHGKIIARLRNTKLPRSQAAAINPTLSGWGGGIGFRPHVDAV